jgi:hypothetical protein
VRLQYANPHMLIDRIFLSLTESQNKTLEQALDTFTQAEHSVLTQAGKTPVVWEGGVTFSCIEKKSGLADFTHHRNGTGAPS